MQHLAIIPDGNRRWAKKNKLESIFGHQRGMETIQGALKVCLKRGIRYVSFYTFSLENFNRSELEKSYLFNLLKNSFMKQLPELIEQGVKVCFIGDRSRFPEEIRQTAALAEEQTKHLDKLQLNLLFCYGGQAEILEAARALAQKVKAGVLDPEHINESMLRDALWTGNIPDPDLVIRTGNTVRTSNFLPFQTAYSEWLFLDKFWPEMTEEIIDGCVHDFVNIKRNFGK
jgi:undecaprenyl diphosphate synthase